jgi:hypothetical protein
MTIYLEDNLPASGVCVPVTYTDVSNNLEPRNGDTRKIIKN